MSNNASSSSKKPASRTNDPYFWQAIALSSLFAVTLPVILGMVVSASNEQAEVAPLSVVENTEPAAVETGGFAQARLLKDGMQVYQNACVVCHGPQGDGIRNLGKPLHNSAFVQSQSDDELFQLITQGRPTTDPANTTGVLMPPRGAVGLEDQQVRQVIAYLRSMQDPSQPTASVEEWQPKPGEEGGGRIAIELPDHPGHDLFIASCAACHGEGAQG
ncbi:MAG: c-type cytochrome, partial [Phycisphaerales bacterium]|nr:c-type cytochrome [Phycisphaerales bacterium]